VPYHPALGAFLKPVLAFLEDSLRSSPPGSKKFSGACALLLKLRNFVDDVSANPLVSSSHCNIGMFLASWGLNLSFRSSIAEAGISGELYPLPIIFKSWGQNLGRFNPYFVIGFNFFRFNPRSLYLDKTGALMWVDLKPLRTEGQGMPIPNAPKEYSLTSTAIPMGVGIRFNLSQNMSLAVEWINRSTGTDYLDDVSGRYIDNAEFDNFFGEGTLQADQAKQKANFPSWLNGVPVSGYLPGQPRGSLKKFNDFFYTTGIKLFVNLDRVVGKSDSWIGGEKYYRCPTRF
jgi:hypothetical protein